MFRRFLFFAMIFAP